MRTKTIPLPPLAPGADLALTVHRFGAAGARPCVYVQAALHADEIPGMMAAYCLRLRLLTLEREGRIAGEIVLVPSANPIGLAQRLLGHRVGRFDLADGANFNRLYPALTQKVAERVEGRLGAEADANVRLIREALRDGIEAWPAATSAEVLKRTLVGLACDADLVLDLHCDAEAAVHLYTLTASAETFAPLAALLGAEAVLLADESGDDPFDEAVSRPWHELRGRFPDRPIPLACQSATVELRGEADVSLALGTADAEALVGFLTLHGAIAGAPPPLPPARCAPTPLAASEPILAPAAGILAFRAAPGDRVAAGDTVADIVDPLTGTVTAAVTASSGVLYARLLTRFVSAGQRIGKVAGTTIARTGKLLGA